MLALPKRKLDFSKLNLLTAVWFSVNFQKTDLLPLAYKPTMMMVVLKEAWTLVHCCQWLESLTQPLSLLSLMVMASRAKIVKR